MASNLSLPTLPFRLLLLLLSLILMSAVALAGVLLLVPRIEAKRTQDVAILSRCISHSCLGTNLNETILTTANVNVDQFGLLFRRKVDGHLYTRPLYVPNMEIVDKGRHNVIYLATQHNTVYAFDADNPAQNTPLWEATVAGRQPVAG